MIFVDSLDPAACAETEQKLESSRKAIDYDGEPKNSLLIAHLIVCVCVRVWQ